MADCQEKDPALCEIYIVEGDSAGGSAKQGRDRKTQAVLPLKGKILNVEKARYDKMLGNAEIKTLIQALGTSIGKDDFDLSRLRYHKIVIMTDADVDGAHIRTLLLTLFYRQFPEIIDKGHLYIAQPPLYKFKKGKLEKYLKDEKELEDFLLSNSVNEQKISINQQLADFNFIKQILRKYRTYGRLLSSYDLQFDTDLLRCLIEKELVTLAILRDEQLLKEKIDFLATELKREDVGNLKRYSFQIEKDTKHESHAIQIEVKTSAKTKKFRFNSYFFDSSEYIELMDNFEGVKKYLHQEFTIEREKGEKRVYFSLSSFAGAALQEGKQGAYIQRYKGLGEMNPEQLWETTMNPETRILKQVNIENAAEADYIFSMLMGDDVGPRREFIEKNATYANIDA